MSHLAVRPGVCVDAGEALLRAAEAGVGHAAQHGVVRARLARDRVHHHLAVRTCGAGDTKISVCARKIFPDAITNHVLDRDPDPLGRELWQAVRESLHRGAADLPAQHRHQGVVAEPEDGRKLFLSTSSNVMKMPHQFTY